MDGVALKLNGLGLREATFLAVDVYVAALYVVQPSHEPHALIYGDSTTRVVMRFVRDVSMEEVRDELNTGLSDNAPRADKAKKKAFLALLKPLSEGDTLTFTYRPGQGLTVEGPGGVWGTIDGLAFARAVLSTLIGPEPPNEGLKEGLLGGPCD